MSNMLNDLVLEEVSLVDEPANASATVALFKRKKPEEVSKMTDEEKDRLKPYMDKGMTEDEARKAYEDDMKKNYDEELEKFKAENQLLRKALIDNGFVIKADSVEKKAPEETIDFDGEQVAKSQIPAPVLKALEEAKAKEQDAEITKRAESELPNFSVEVAKKILATVDDDEVMKALKAADELFGKSMEEVGSTDPQGEMSEPKAQLEKKVEEVMKADGVSYYVALDKVSKTKEGRELITKSYYEKD